MGRADFEFRITIERPFEDQMGQRYGCCQRIPDYIVQVAVPLKALLTFREPRRVYENPRDPNSSALAQKG